MTHWYKEYKALVESAETYYIRFGDIPEGERSAIGASPNFIANMFRTGDEEEGVSVYDARWLEKKEAWSIDEINVASLDELIAQKRPAYLVTGDLVGTGIDGEPLLHNVKIVKQIPYTEIWIPAWDEYAEEEDYRVEYPAKDDDLFIKLHTSGASKERAFGFFNDLYRAGLYVMWGNNNEIFINKKQFDMKKVKEILKQTIDRYENNSVFRVVADKVLPHNQIKEVEPAGFRLYGYYDLKDQ